MKYKKNILLLLTLVVLAGCTGKPISEDQSLPASTTETPSISTPASSEPDVVDDIETDKDPFDVDGNFEEPELTIDGFMTEEEWTDSEWASPVVTIGRHDGNEASLRFYRGEKALFAFFEVKDKNILTDGFANGDPVNRSDSVELYLDTDNDGINNQGDDLQVNIGVHGRTRILTGSDNVWGAWNGLVNFEVSVDGSINDESDTDVGFNIEIMIPYGAINMSRNDVIGFSLGAPDRYLAGGNIIGTNYDWFGWHHEGVFVDPQQASAYMVYTNNQIMTRSQYNALP